MNKLTFFRYALLKLTVVGVLGIAPYAWGQAKDDTPPQLTAGQIQGSV